MNSTVPEKTTSEASLKPAYVVASDGTGTHQTISEAIEGSLPGATIEIRPGIYEEVLVISKPVTLAGAEDALVVIHHPTFTAISVRKTECVLQNLALGAEPGRTSLSCDAAKIHLKNCLVAPTADLRQIATTLSEALERPLIGDSIAQESGEVPAVALSNGSSAYIQGNSFRNLVLSATDSGVVVDGTSFHESRVLLTGKVDSTISDCRFDGDKQQIFVTAGKASVLKLENCRFNLVSGAAVYCHSSQTTLVGCEFLGTFTPPLKKAHQNLPAGAWVMCSVAIPPVFQTLHGEAYKRIGKEEEEDYHQVVGRFLGKIHVTDGSRKYENVYYNPVVKKILWEYKTRYGDLVYPEDGHNTVSIEQVLSPIVASEIEAFTRFCKEQDDLESPPPVCAAICSEGEVSLRLEAVQIKGFQRGMIADCSGQITIEDCTFSDNAVGLTSDVSDVPGSLRLQVARSNFLRNCEIGISVRSRAQTEQSAASLEYCSIRENRLGISFMGWRGGITKCTFADNSYMNIWANPLFILKSVVDCKGFGDSGAFRFAQKVRHFLPF